MSPAEKWLEGPPHIMTACCQPPAVIASLGFDAGVGRLSQINRRIAVEEVVRPELE